MHIDFKRTLIAGAMAMLLSAAQAAENGVGGYWADNFIPRSMAVKDNLLQSATGYNNSCGPTALLFAKNHLMLMNGQTPTFTTSVTNAKTAIQNMYNYRGLTLNTTTSLDDLKAIALGYFQYPNTRRMITADGLSLNMDRLVYFLQKNVPAIIPLSKNYSGNPLPGYDHLVVIFAYNRMTDEFGRLPLDSRNTRNLDVIDFFEPYYGIQGRVLRKDASSAFAAAGFSFLEIQP